MSSGGSRRISLRSRLSGLSTSRSGRLSGRAGRATTFILLVSGRLSRNFRAPGNNTGFKHALGIRVLRLLSSRLARTILGHPSPFHGPLTANCTSSLFGTGTAGFTQVMFVPTGDEPFTGSTFVGRRSTCEHKRSRKRTAKQGRGWAKPSPGTQAKNTCNIMP